MVHNSNTTSLSTSLSSFSLVLSVSSFLHDCMLSSLARVIRVSGDLCGDLAWSRTERSIVLCGLLACESVLCMSCSVGSRLLAVLAMGPPGIRDPTVSAHADSPVVSPMSPVGSAASSDALPLEPRRVWIFFDCALFALASELSGCELESAWSSGWGR